MNQSESETRGRDVIFLAEDREVIKTKLAEYRKRLDQFQAPELQLDTIYKIAIAEKLDQDGQVDLDDIQSAMLAKFGAVELNILMNAWGVIKDYVITGGKYTKGGTGLPKRENTEEPSQNPEIDDLMKKPDGRIH